MENLLHFLKSQKLLIVASSQNDQPWVANVYFVTGDDGKLYFLSREVTKHSDQITKNPRIAFSSVWYDPSNLRNRKAVQGIGICQVVDDEREMRQALKLYHEQFPDSQKSITLDWIQHNDHRSRFWAVKPTYMKLWNDEQYGEDGSKEFHW